MQPRSLTSHGSASGETRRGEVHPRGLPASHGVYPRGTPAGRRNSPAACCAGSGLTPSAGGSYSAAGSASPIRECRMPERVFLIDGLCQIFRCYYAPFRNLTSPAGRADQGHLRLHQHAASAHPRAEARLPGHGHGGRRREGRLPQGHRPRLQGQPRGPARGSGPPDQPDSARSSAPRISPSSASRASRPTTCWPRSPASWPGRTSKSLWSARTRTSTRC